MGAALSSRANWISVSETGGKLDFSKSNESLLQDIVRQVERLVRDHAREAEVSFSKPFTWHSSLKISTFDSLKPPDYIKSETTVESAAKLKNGDPILSITKLDESVEIKASNFKCLVQVMSCAGEKKLKEAQLCLEANSDPMIKIIGSSYSSQDSNKILMDVHDKLARDKIRGSGDNVDDSTFRLLLLLNDIDIQLMQSSLKQLGRDVRLTPNLVQSEVELLQTFTGSPHNCLKTLEYTTALAFTNGCRAPPWRQVLGDICYIMIQSFDTDLIYVTASTEGYFINKGIIGGEQQYERTGELYPTLVSLLKSSSKHFAESIIKQEFMFTEEEHTDAGELELFSTAPQPLTATIEETETVENKEEPPPLSDKPTSKSATKLQTSTKEKKKSTKKGVRTATGNDQFSTAHESPLFTGTKRLETQQSIKIRSASSIQSNNIEELSDSSSEGSEEEETQERRPESTADLPSEYWQIQKLIKYLKGGNQTTTVIALCSLRDFDLTQETSHLAIRDNNGLDLLINLLETEDIKCKIGTLRILCDISTHPQTRVAIVDLKGLPQLVQILKSPVRELKCLAAETIANIAKFRRARKIVRTHGGLRYLVNMLEDPGRPGSPITGERSDVEVARCAALGLWSCSKSKKNKQALLKTNVVTLLGRYLQSDKEDVLIPIVGTLQECASEPKYQELIQAAGMIELLVKGLHVESQELQMHCASAIFKCAEEDKTRQLVREFNGLEPLSKQLARTDNKELLTAVTGAIWKCAKNSENVQQLKAFKAVEKLVSLLSNQPEEVLINVIGAIAECAARDNDNRVTIRKSGGVVPLVQLLTGTNQSLLINTTKAVGACALDNDSMMIIDKQDGVRLLWSLLKSPNPEVQACAAWAICPCIQNAKDAGELVRSFVGGLELIVGLLKSSDIEVLASVCAAIAKIAQDQENLAVVTDHGVVPLLAQLTTTTNDKLRHHLADAIAKCCLWRNNRVGFGQNHAVAPLVEYLHSTDTAVHQTTACALHQLSRHPDNCIVMHEASVVELLLPMVGSTDKILQEAAAGCISNIRQLALANEKAKYK